MNFREDAWGITRRSAAIRAASLLVSAASIRSVMAASKEFWNRKESAAWSDDEIKRMLSDSPWAHVAAIHPKDRPLTTNGGNPDLSNDTRNLGRLDSNNTPTLIGPDGKAMDRLPGQLTVRWESAAPIIEALREPIPGDFAGHYAVGIVQPPPGDADATLQAKGKEPVQAGITHKTRMGVLVFGFSKELLPLGLGDKDVEFNVETAQFSLQAKFQPKDMIYKGGLSL